MLGLCCCSCCRIETVTNLALGDFVVAMELCRGLELTSLPALSEAFASGCLAATAGELDTSLADGACFDWSREVTA